MEQSTLYMLCSPKASHPTLLSQPGVFSGAVMAEHFIATSVTVHSLYFFYTLLLYIDSRQKRKQKGHGFKNFFTKAVPSFPHRGPDPDSTKSVRHFPFLQCDFVQNEQACKNLHMLSLNWPKHLIAISWQFSLSCIFVLCLTLTLSDIKRSCSTSSTLRQHVKIWLNNTTAEADSSLLICAEFCFL